MAEGPRSRAGSRGATRRAAGPSPNGAVLQFGAAGVAAMIALTGVSALLLRRSGTAEAIRNARDIVGVQARSVVEPNLTPAVLRGDPAAVARFDRLMRERVLVPPAVRLKLWASDGRIVYSDEPRLVGAVYPLHADDLAALRDGSIAANLSGLEAPENRFERSHGKLLQVYVGVQATDGERVLFESYLTFRSVTASGRRIWLSFAPALVGALLLLELVQLPLAYSLVQRVRLGLRDREALMRRAIEASDAERRRIARDLHDGVVQNLAGVSYSLAAAANDAASAGMAGLSRSITDASASTRTSMRSLRTLLVDIYPPNLRQAGLEAALTDALAPLAAAGVSTTLDLTNPALTLSDEHERLVYRVAQEALRNALKHADAGHVTVRVSADADGAALLVRDDGRGFSPDAAARRAANGHLGLRLLAELAADAGGALSVSASPGHGTTVRLEVPAP